ncbi:MAG: hypothetical protein K2W94_03915 [Alphaproteobacteria bacterium]|nr:hypothetical protein [Alphaproteobacteria bacterium]
MKKDSIKKQQNQIVLHESASQVTTSFWGYETKEDRVARNLWIYFMIGLVTFSFLALSLNVFNA